MFRALFRVILVVVVVVAIAAFFMGYRWGTPRSVADRPVERPIGTAGSGIDAGRARAAGAEVGEKVATGVNEAQQQLADAALTAKIKSKMALDDSIEARRIDVDTNGTVVTLSGTVRSAQEKAKALQLARDTAGVTSVVDRLSVSGSR
jgi:osmotically-inducible protein OsmY